MSGIRRGHAIVVGGSMAGMLAARVLADHFERVTLVERDHLPSSPEPRLGLPAARHLQLLLTGGSDALEALFPGFWDEMVRDGAKMIDPGRDAVFFREGAWGTRSAQTDLRLHLQSRDLLDWQIRRRMRRLDAVSIRDGCRVEGLAWNDRHVKGIRIRQTASSIPTVLDADLVVVAGGRHCQLPNWLATAGRGRVATEEVAIGVTYSSCVVRPSLRTKHDWEALVVATRPDVDHRHGMIMALEGGLWMVTLAEYFGRTAKDHDDFLDQARSLPVPDFHDAIRDATPLTPVLKHRVPSNLWRRYDRLAEFPERLVVVGDAVCSLNPIYAQGMTSAARGAMELARCLEQRRERRSTDFGRGFQHRLAKQLQPAWNWAHAHDLRIPQVRGRRCWSWRVREWYQRRLADLATWDQDIQRLRLKAWLAHGDTAELLRADVVWKALRPADHKARAALQRPPRPPRSSQSVSLS